MMGAGGPGLRFSGLALFPATLDNRCGTSPVLADAGTGVVHEPSHVLRRPPAPDPGGQGPHEAGPPAARVAFAVVVFAARWGPGMRLLWSSRSPFVRKVMIAVHELGLQDRVELERVLVAAHDGNPAVMRLNPLNQIPTLVLDDGTVLFDSPVIVEYLDAVHGGGRLLPAEPARRWPVLRLQALGDGLMALGVQRLGERNRGPLCSTPHAEAFAAKSRATLDLLEREAATLASLSAGSIAVASALGHLDFRFAADAWRDARPALAAWFAAMAVRPSMIATEPVEVY